MQAFTAFFYEPMPALHKRTEFKHENETQRIISSKKWGKNKRSNNTKVIYFSVQ